MGTDSAMKQEDPPPPVDGSSEVMGMYPILWISQSCYINIHLKTHLKSQL